MAEYRADIVDTEGRVVRAIELACPNDEIAKEHAKSLGYNVELWRDGRQIAKINQKPQIRANK